MGCCTGSTFTPAPDAALDPLQRVNYTFGMVLGVDDFRQEHAYLAARDERALRETIGYGVITGLDVLAPKPASSSEGQQVRVTHGLALTPDGRLVAVAQEQCANLQTWLDAELARDATTASRTTVYVLLRFAEASGSPVPIPGEPCRDESELSADARIADSFALDFSWTPPDASEDLALRAVVAWIRGIKVRSTAPAGQTLASFQAQVEAGLKEAIAAAWGDPHAPTPAMPADHTPALPQPSKAGLPPPPRELQIPRAELAAYYAAAFEVWTRLLRSGFMAHHGPVPVAEPVAERALLLAAIDAKAGAGGARAVHMGGRPQLLHLRLLQEWLLRDGSQDAPREAHFVLGKGDPALEHAQDLLADFKTRDHAMTRIDIVADTTDGAAPDDKKAKLVPAVKWPGGPGSGGEPDYYGPDMKQPIPVADGGTGQNLAPAKGALLVGRAVNGTQAARFELGALTGAALPRPVGPSPNILVDVANAPTIRLDTVQDIGPGASPVFAGLDVNGTATVSALVVEKDAHVTGSLSVDGELVIGAPLNSLLASDDKGVVVAARPWDGDEAALAAGKPPPFVYAPGEKAPVRIEDGGTGLNDRPEAMQMLIGVKGATGRGGDYALATLVNGKNTQVNLRAVTRGQFELSIDAGGGGTATQVVAAGNASNPPSLTAVTAGSVVTINTVQPLHTGAAPRFQALSLAALPQRTTSTLVGWDASSGELVQTAAPTGVAADVGQWGIRYVRKPNELVVTDKDHVLVVLINGNLALPDLTRGSISEGRVIVIKLSGNATDFVVDGIEGTGRQGMKTPNSLTLIAATKLDPPQWLVIARV